MTEQCFQLVADVSSDDPAAIEPLLRRLVQGQITVTAGGFPVEADMIGASAPDLNHWLRSALRRVERWTRLQAEWSARPVSPTASSTRSPRGPAGELLTP
jgi:hypothetical protein